MCYYCIIMKLIKRTTYLEKLNSVRNVPDIKVITGVRRSGKSQLLLDFSMHIKTVDRKANIIFINLQDLDNNELLDYKKLHEFVMSKYEKNKNNYVFIDEVQLCKNFEKTINSLHSKLLFDIYITGSNAFLLSSDLATLFTGRTFPIDVYPFSYKEFLLYHNTNNDLDSFERYVYEGGFAGSYVYNSNENKYNYLRRDILDLIIKQDLVKKYNIRNEHILNKIVDFMLDNISNLTSANNITNIFNQNKYSITNKTVDKYLSYLCLAFIFYKVNRFDLKGKKYLVTDNKYYLVDHSLRYASHGTRNIDYGRVYENIVYIELLRRGYNVYIGKLYNKEIDFVVEKQGQRTYIQVCDDLTNKKTLEREIAPLKAIKDAYPKIVIARTKHPVADLDGIQIFDIADWLLN